LLDPTEPAPRQGGDIGAYNRFKPNVAGLCEQDRTETDRQVCHPRRPFTDMGKFMGEPGACMDFEEHLRQIYLWEPGEHVVPQCDQAGRLLELIESRER
jgi:hypothetical protein